MKKVLFLLEGFNKGGIEKVTLDIVNHLDPEKYDITVQTFWYGGHCQSLVNPNIKVKPFFFKRYVRGIIRLVEYLSPKMLYRLFVHGDYDIEIAASDGGAAKVISGSTNKKAKKICWVHMDVSDQGANIHRLLHRKSPEAMYSQFDRIVCVSGNARERFVEKFGFAEKTVTVHNPIPVDDIRIKAREPLSIPYDLSCFNIVAVGNLMQVKGYERLIRVCGKMEQMEHLKIRLYLVGNGPLWEYLHAIVRDHAYVNVIFLDFQDNPYPYIQNADLFVCSSYSEAYSLVIGESMVLGTPVLGTLCSGVCEWMEKDQSGLIVENSEAALYDGIKLLAENQAVYKDYKKRVINKQKTFNFENAMEVWERAFLS